MIPIFLGLDAWGRTEATFAFRRSPLKSALFRTPQMQKLLLFFACKRSWPRTALTLALKGKIFLPKPSL